MAKIKGVKKSPLMSEDKKKEGSSVYDLITFIPIIIVIVMVPLVIRLKIQEATGQDMSYALGASHVDLFSYWKSNLIFIMAIVMLGLFVFFFNKKGLKYSKVICLAACALGIFVLFSLASAMFSPHQSLVWWGQYSVRSGLVIIVSYVLICCYSMHFYKAKEDSSYVIIPLTIMIILEGIIIFSQFMGKDIILSDFIKSIIIPMEYGNIGDTMNLAIKGKSYGTLFNPNYVGSFVALLLPIFTFVSLKAKDIKWKVLYLFVAIVLIFSLFASGSRAGIMGIGASVLVGNILWGQFLLKNPKVVGLGVIAMVVVGLSLNIATSGLVAERIGSITKDVMSVFSSSDSDILANSAIKDMYIVDNKFTIDFEEQQLNLIIDSNDEVLLTDENGKNIDYKREQDVYIVPSASFPVPIKLQEGEITQEGKSQKLYMVEIDNSQWFVVTKEDENLVSLDKYGNPIDIKIAESIGFSGKEQIGSNRGYIWSRSLPIFRDNLILGVGPDAFVAEFPHGDILVRNAVYGYTGAIVDKPHNLYLQIGINQGIIALAAFLVLNITYIVNSFKVYFKKKEYSFHDMFGIGIMLGIVGYLGAGMFNDSVVSVAPLYWCLLGIGYAVNYINSGDSL